MLFWFFIKVYLGHLECFTHLVSSTVRTYLSTMLREKIENGQKPSYKGRPPIKDIMYCKFMTTNASLAICRFAPVFLMFVKIAFLLNCKTNSFVFHCKMHTLHILIITSITAKAIGENKQICVESNIRNSNIKET